MKSFRRSSSGLVLAAVLAACADPAGLRSPMAGAVPNALQAPSLNQVTTSNNGLMTVAPAGPLGTAQPWTQPFGSNAIKIHGNLGEGGTAYDARVGYTVSGSTSAAGANVVSASGFVPGDDYTVTGIALALAHASGPNVYTVSLNADSSGVPGAVLRSWTVRNLAIFGTCCAVAVVRSWSALPVTQGTKYWVVAAAESHNTWGAWNLDIRGGSGHFAQRINGSWLGAGFGTQGAFAVYGRPN